MKIAYVHLWVHDQDAALAFYTQTLGMEVRADVTLPEVGSYRWLTVGPVGQPDIAIVLDAVPGPPAIDEATAAQLRELTAKGWAGSVFLTSDDVYGLCEELRERGVEFVEEPEKHRYGIDSALRDPSGNSIRIMQLTEGPEA